MVFCSDWIKSHDKRLEARLGLVQQAVKLPEVAVLSLIPNQTLLTNPSSERVREKLQINMQKLVYLGV